MLSVHLLCVLVFLGVLANALRNPLNSTYIYSRDIHPHDTTEALALPDGMISAAWYAGWHSGDFPVSDISWSKYTNMNYAFATTTPDKTALFLADQDQVLLHQFVSAAHKNNVKAGLSIGGWTGSRYFSTHVGSQENRTIFVKAVTDVVAMYNLDGIDFDWEYPGLQGIGCNIINPNDTPNFLSFLQDLRKTSIGANITLSAATATIPFADSSGNPSTDISGFSKVLDYIAIMNYDVRSSPSGLGPSAPIDDSCAPVGHQFGSAASAIKAWSGAGMPVNQIVLGVPGYGHSYQIAPNVAFAEGSNAALATYPPFDPAERLLGDRWDGDAGRDVCGAQQGPGGVYTYWGLIEEEFLNTDGSARDGVVYRYDNCSETPYVYKRETETMVSFDNPQSFSAKGDFVKTTGLKGFAMWEAGGDYNNSLLDTILNATVNGDPTRPEKAQTSPATVASAAPPSCPRSLLGLIPQFSLGFFVFSIL